MTTRSHDTAPAPAALIPVVDPLVEPIAPLKGKSIRDHIDLANGTKVFVRAKSSRYVWSAHAVDNSTIGNGYVQKGVIHTTFGTCPSEVEAAIRGELDLENDPDFLRKQREDKALKAKQEVIDKADAAYDETVSKAVAKHTEEMVHSQVDAAKAAAVARAKAESIAAKK